VERRLLDVYWALSGYGLRAWRAVAALIVLLLACSVLLTHSTFANVPQPDRISSVDTRTGTVRYAPTPVRGVRPGSKPAVTLARATEFTARESLTVTRGPGIPLLDITGPGTAVDIALRVLAPLLLGLAVLAVRGRTKR
jgi:hypothetical protein